jgi:hypothetical protein
MSKVVFIISQPSSGSTLLQTMLAQHKMVYTYEESWLMLHFLYAFKEDGIISEYSRETYLHFIKNFTHQFERGEQVYYDEVRKCCNSLFNILLIKNGKEVYVDKTPRYYLIIPELKRTFPDAKFIFLLRNPLAVLISHLNIIPRKRWVSWAQYNRIDLLEAPQLIYNQKQFSDKNDLFLNYEDLVLNPGKVIKKTLEFIGIPFQDGLDHYGNFNRKFNSSKWGDNSGNIHKYDRPNIELIDRWKLRIDSHEKKIFLIRYLDALGKPLFEGLGYDFEKNCNLVKAKQVPLFSSVIIPWKFIIGGKKTSNLSRIIRYGFNRIIV